MFCEGVRFGVVFRGDNALTSLFILFRYASISGEAGGGFHKLFPLKGCIVAGCLLLKKSFNLLLLSKFLRGSGSWLRDPLRLGTKGKPRERTSTCGGVRVLEERLVIYFCLFNNFFDFLFWFVYVYGQLCSCI